MILIIDDDFAVRASLALLLKKEGYASHGVATPAEALDWLATGQPELILLDMNFSLDTSGEEGLQLLALIRERQPAAAVILITGWATVGLAVEGMKLGARDFINKPWDNEYLIQSIRTVLDLSRLKGGNMSRKKLAADYDFGHIIGQAPSFMKVLETVGRVAATDAPVLIMGESGTGKELIAEAIHQNSQRRTKPFVKVNLGGISSSLFESEMFGHVRGAFTDARSDRVGRFELAHTGTIFLDEIGDLGLSSQVKLLRVLQDRTYEVLGSSRTRRVDVRVISATNRPLEEMVAEGAFREDLFYRLNVIPIHLPPLRERRGDIALHRNQNLPAQTFGGFGPHPVRLDRILGPDHDHRVGIGDRPLDHPPEGFTGRYRIVAPDLESRRDQRPAERFDPLLVLARVTDEKLRHTLSRASLHAADNSRFCRPSGTAGRAAVQRQQLHKRGAVRSVVRCGSAAGDGCLRYRCARSSRHSPGKAEPQALSASRLLVVSKPPGSACPLPGGGSKLEESLFRSAPEKHSRKLQQSGGQSDVMNSSTEGRTKQLWHTQPIEATLEAMDTTRHGLSQQEAEIRSARYGPNRLPPPKRRGPLLRFLLQFHNVLIYVLLAAALVTALLAHWVDTGVIVAVVLAGHHHVLSVPGPLHPATGSP